MKYYEQIHRIEYKSGGKVNLYYLSLEWMGTGVWQEGLDQARLWKYVQELTLYSLQDLAS